MAGVWVHLGAGQLAIRPLKNYLRCRYGVKNKLGCEPRLGAPIKMLIYNSKLRF